VTNPTAWANWGMDFPNEMMSSFMGGARQGR